MTLTSLIAMAVQADKSNPVPAVPPLVWPAPPETARVAFVKTVMQPTDLGATVSGLKRAANWIAGAQEGNEPFSKPFGIAFDENDNLCLTDTGNNTVCFLDPKAKRWLRWDKVGNVRFVSPVAVGKRGDTIFVADSGLGEVIAFDLKGKLRLRLREKLERPSGLVLSGDRLFVADASRHTVVSFDLKGRFIAESGKRGTGPGEFNFPTHLAADADGNLFVTDSMNSRVQVLDRALQPRAEIGSVGDSPGHFSRPKGVAVDRSGHVFVVDAMFDNIQVFDRGGQFLLNLGTAGSGPGEFWLPNGIAINRAGEILVTDSYNHRLQVLKYIGPP